MMRLFVGIPVPQRVAQALLHYARGLRPGAESAGKSPPRWTLAENMHLTLVFLGEVAEERLSAIAAEIEALRVPHLHLRINGLGTFPRAGVLFAEIEPSPALVSLQDEVARRMARIGFKLEDRAYHPHLTLARMHSPIRLKQTELALPKSVSHSWTADEVVLYRSHTSPNGSQYEPLLRNASGPL